MDAQGILKLVALLSKVSGAVTQGNQRYVLVVGSLLTDDAHNCSIRVFAYCSPLPASTLTSDNFQNQRRSAS
jgi:hypothetical protein